MLKYSQKVFVKRLLLGSTHKKPFLRESLLLTVHPTVTPVTGLGFESVRTTPRAGVQDGKDPGSGLRSVQIRTIFTIK